MMELLISPAGSATAIYGEEIDLSALGDLSVRRASHVEPDSLGQWWADLSPVSGPRLGPFSKRSRALEAELGWLRLQLPDLNVIESQTKECGT